MKTLSYILAVIFLALTVYFFVRPVRTVQACGCNSNDWTIHSSIYYAWKHRTPVMALCVEGACAHDPKVIPVDAFLLTLLFTGIGWWKAGTKREQILQ